MLVVLADGALPRFAAWVYGMALAAMFGASALYHRYPVQVDRGRRVWARRLDHSTIFLFIAGTYTPFALLAFEGDDHAGSCSRPLGSAPRSASCSTSSGSTRPKWVTVLAYIAVGWVGVITIPQMLSGVGVPGSVLVMIGGVLYTLGAVVYATTRPNPFPATFGFHEIFHVLVVAAASVQFVAVSLVVL